MLPGRQVKNFWTRRATHVEPKRLDAAVEFERLAFRKGRGELAETEGVILLGEEISGRLKTCTVYRSCFQLGNPFLNPVVW
jgi:hypothetical protein